MDARINIIKGLHPGIILERELKKRGLLKGRFAISIGEYPQTLVAIIKGKRRMNPELSLRIEHTLNLDEGFFMILQAYYDIAQAKKELAKHYHPDLGKINPVVFWDTKIENINWDKNKTAVIRRIFERGTNQEIREIIRFYGKDTILNSLEGYTGFLPTLKENTKKYL